MNDEKKTDTHDPEWLKAYWESRNRRVVESARKVMPFWAARWSRWQAEEQQLEEGGEDE
jgi:hypothetical protein